MTVRRVLKPALALFVAILFGGVKAPLVAHAAEAPAQPDPTLAALAAAKLQVVDLGWPLNAGNIYWPGENYRPFELRTLATIEKNGVLSKAFATPEHLGTHLDAPNHFAVGQRSVDAIPPEELFAPGVLLDVSSQCAADPDYRLAPADVDRWELQHGRITAGAVVLVRTGWSRFWTTPDRYQGRDARGVLHFPGFSAEAVERLIERGVRGVGIDTMSVDHGPSRDFPVHHRLAKANKYGLENLTALDRLPAGRFYLVVAPIKIETGSGGPTRVFAILP